MKLWGGRFNKETDELLEQFGTSIQFDHILWQEDLLGSHGHVNGLLQANIITYEEAQQLHQGLQQVEMKIAAGQVNFSVADEDIHMNIERLLHQEIGELAGKIHTGRSRNDQVALDMRLYLRKQLLILIEDVTQLQHNLLEQALQHQDTLFPGYTHLQRAQPIYLAQHFLAYYWMFSRDVQRLKQVFDSTNKSPLGAGALAGNSFALDQVAIAQKLQFDAVYENSLDAVSDRDYLVEFLTAASLIMMHLSKICEELIIWSSQEFNFVELDDAFCTGSSMMPQKKNPDSAELIRGKTGRVYGALMSLLTTLKGLPLAYNKDLQEDKEGVFDTVKTLHFSIAMMSKMIATLKINQKVVSESLSSGFLHATELANYLVKKGLPFRKAHEVIGNLVKHCVVNQTALDKSVLQQACNLFDDDVEDLLEMKNVVAQYNNACGTAKSSILKQQEQASHCLSENIKWLKLKFQANSCQSQSDSEHRF